MMIRDEFIFTCRAVRTTGSLARRVCQKPIGRTRGEKQTFFIAFRVNEKILGPTVFRSRAALYQHQKHATPNGRVSEGPSYSIFAHTIGSGMCLFMFWYQSCVNKSKSTGYFTLNPEVAYPQRVYTQSISSKQFFYVFFFFKKLIFQIILLFSCISRCAISEPAKK